MLAISYRLVSVTIGASDCIVIEDPSASSISYSSRSVGVSSKIRCACCDVFDDHRIVAQLGQVPLLDVDWSRNTAGTLLVFRSVQYMSAR